MAVKASSGGYQFRYTLAFRHMNLSPLPGLPAGKALLFSELPAFSRNGFRTCGGPEIREAVEKSGIPKENKLRLLAAFGSHAIADPFEFRLKVATA